MTLGDEWDDALRICAEYLESAGETPEEIVRALNEIAGAIGGTVQVITHIVQMESPSKEPGDVSENETETEQAAAEPPGENENTRNCPNGTCPGTVRNYQRWSWWWY